MNHTFMVNLYFLFGFKFYKYNIDQVFSEFSSNKRSLCNFISNEDSNKNKG